MTRDYQFFLRRGLDIGASLALIVLTCLLCWDRFLAKRPTAPSARVTTPSASQPLDGAHMLGRRDAPVAIIAYSDFQCPFCARFALDTLPQLTKKYIHPGHVQIAFRHLPLERIHPYALRAATAAVCAERVGKFWNIHDAFFAEPSWTANTVDLVGARLGLGSDWMHCLETEGAAKVRGDIAAAKALGIASTPAFFIGRRQSDGTLRVSDVVTGARPIAAFEAVLQRLLGKSR